MRKIAAVAIVLALAGAGTITSTAQAGSTCWTSPRGCVQVNGYFKPSTGTYVRPHVRNYPRPRYTRPSYTRPSYLRPSYTRPRYGYLR